MRDNPFKVLLYIVLVALALTVNPTQAMHRGNPAAVVGIQVYPGCTPVPASFNGTVHYVNPAGSDSNPGTIGSPWQTIFHGSQLVANGDTIYLQSGTYPSDSIHASPNTGFVRLAPAPGATVTFAGVLTVYDSSYWVIENFSGLSKFQGIGVAAFIYNPSDNPATPSGNLVVYNNDFSSAPDAVALTWTAAQYQTNGAGQPGYAAVSFDGGDISGVAGICQSVTYNNFHSLRWGAALGTNYVLFDHNIVDHFGDDAVDFSGSNITISYNVLTNSFYVNDNNHNDLAQFQIGHCLVLFCTYTNIKIIGNYANEITVAAAALPLSAQCTGNGTQGIGNFDEDLDGGEVYDNIVVACATHVLAFDSVHHFNIANNTAIETFQGIGGAFGGCELNAQSNETTGTGTQSDNDHVWNNICSSIENSSFGAGVTTIDFDHNLILTGGQIQWWYGNTPLSTSTPGSYAHGLGSATNTIITASNSTVFNTFNNSTAGPSYDLHIPIGSPARQAGTLAAPACPDTSPRPPNPDLGGYC